MGDKVQKKILLIYNPSAGSGYIKQNIDLIIERAQREGCELIVYRVTKPGQITDYIKNNVKEGIYERLLISGGDGTLNECIGTILEEKINLPIAILPFGTANDFATTLGIKGNIEDILDIAFGNEYRHVDICKANEKYFINVCAMGMFAGTSQRMNKKFKKQFGKYAYYIKALEDVINYPNMNLRITSGEQVVVGNYILVLVLNGSGAGGFNNILDMNSLEDGQIDLLCIKPTPIYCLPEVFLSIIKGQYNNHVSIDYLKSNQFLIESIESNQLIVDIDGENGPTVPVNVEVIHQAIKVFAKSQK